MQANYVQRLRFTFSKDGPTRFIGHLDLARSLERSLNRAQIPVAYSQGFNRRPRMQMATALPLGYTSDCELLDIWLTEKMMPARAQRQIMEKMAPGITIHQATEVPLSEPSLQTQTVESAYHVTLLDAVDVEDLQHQIETLLAAESHIRERSRGKKRKPYDLRPLIIELQLNETENRAVTLSMRLYQMPGKTGRPDEVLLALDLDPLSARVQRTKLILSEDGIKTSGGS